MALSTSNKVLLIVAGLLLVGVGVLTWRLRSAEGKLREESLGRVNDRARADSSRNVAISGLNDSLKAQQRLVIQERQRIDNLARQIGGIQVSITNVTTSIKDLERTNIPGTTTTLPDASKETRFAVRDPPYTVDARVLHRSATEPIMSRLSIRLDTARVQLRLTCGDRLPGNVRPAQVTLIAPSWLFTRLDSLSQSDEICSPEEKRERWSIGATAGYGMTYVADSSKFFHGPSISAGLTYRVAF